MSERITTINPATEEEIDHFDLISDGDAEAAIQRCHDAFVLWSQRPAEERAEIIGSIGETLAKNKEALATKMTEEVGKLIGDSRDEVDLCAAICKFTAENGPEQLKEEERPLFANEGRGVVAHRPIGVIYGIQPWNFPSYQVIRYSIANLMAGNGVLLKHASNCTGTGIMLRHLYEEAGLPEDLFSVLVIDHDQSNKVIDNDLVRGVTLTGSDAAGHKIGERAGAALKKTVLELGSNDAYLVLDDADLDVAVKTSVQGRLYNNAQTCINAKRFIATEAVYDEFLERFVEAMKAVKVGDPMDEDSELGPMARGDLRDKLIGQMEESVEKGARIETGGKKLDRTGFYFEPTILSGVAPGMPAYEDEFFGPVASVIKAVDDVDAVRIANESRYGLGGGIFSRDEERAKRIAIDHFDTGMVFINSFGLADPNMPFGGVKDSGYGREHGGFGMKEFTNAKAVFLGA
ncbi:NAD-dependent succinate-semialdehyde dehydrogenase [Sphingomicrobium arenosum]|uniref:NAD-dependent succinate-semialdehyde dehydrogenase n=1 Tax=Sphingomicrobium arenosum TaxID=2233861 RepID=UPI002240A8F8|nr:NAD-dependent succinate-semialdehyde dehydrogenase [Sphingomicrobium arenosum]